MSKKYQKILITVIAPHFELMNRYSAVASVIYSFADLLRNNGHEIYVNEFKLEDWERKHFPDKSSTSTIVKSKIHRFFPSRIRELIKDLLLFRSNKKMFKRICCIPKPDLILSWVTYGNSYGIDLAKQWGIPVVAIFDNPLAEEYTYLKGFPPFFKNLIDREEKRSIKQANSVIVYSRAVKEHLEKKYQIQNRFYFKAFTDFKRMNYLCIKKDLSVINFAYIGSFFNWHKIEDLIEVFTKINKTHSNCRLYLIGDGPEYLKFKSSLNNPKIILTGKLDGASLNDLLNNIHVGVISNALWFHAPVKLFQYSAAGLAVVSVNTPTIKELTQNKIGYSFFDNKMELENQMKHLLENPKQIDSNGAKVREHVKSNFSESNYSEFLNGIIQGLK